MSEEITKEVGQKDLTKQLGQLENAFAKLAGSVEVNGAVTDETKESFKLFDKAIRDARAIFGVSGYARKGSQPSPEGYLSMEEFADLLGVKLVTLRSRWPLYRVEGEKFESRRGMFFPKAEAEAAAVVTREKREAKAQAKAAKEAAKVEAAVEAQKAEETAPQV